MAVDEKKEGAKGCADDLLREVCEELEAAGCGASVGSMAPMEDLHGRIVAYLDKAKAGTALDQLARKIAENTVRPDIESYAEWVEVDGLQFLDTTKPQRGSGDPVKALEYVRFAVEYIDQRGDAFDWHMQRHITAPHLVRFVEKENGNG